MGGCSKFIVNRGFKVHRKRWSVKRGNDSLICSGLYLTLDPKETRDLTGRSRLKHQNGPGPRRDPVGTEQVS